MRKFPRNDNWFARGFHDAMTAPGGVAGFRNLLASLASDPVMGRHVPRLYRVDRFGGTESEYVDGMNLAVLRAAILEQRPVPPGFMPASILQALRQLRADLRSHWAGGGARCGDWDLQNLIYETSTGVIKNVDDGGFTTYRDGDPRCSDEYIALLLDGMEEVLALACSNRPDDRVIFATLSAAWKSTHSGKPYSGGRYLAGYHSLRIMGRYFRGQRDCEERLASVPFEFADRVVLDLGCNVGGMLHPLARVVREGIGVDGDSRCINAANLVAQVNGAGKLHFHTFDLERDELADLRVLTLGRKIDICLMLSVAMWIANWKEVVHFASTLANFMLFETNGSTHQQDEQLAQLRHCFSDVTLLQDRSPDDPFQKHRALYLCSGSRPAGRAPTGSRHSTA